MRDVAIVGAAISDVARRSSKTIGRLAVESCRRALADAGLRLEDVDGISNYPNPSRVNAGSTDGVDFASVDYVARTLGLTSVQWGSSQTRGSFTGSIVEAANAVAAGACTVALVWRAMHNPPGSFGRPEPTDVAGDKQFSFPYGFGNEVVKWTLPYARYLNRYGIGEDALWGVVGNARDHGSKNPSSAFFGQKLTRDDYLASRYIVEPTRLHDCDMPVDASSAVVVTTVERARDLPHRSARIVAGVNGGFPPRRRPTYVLEDHQQQVAHMATTAMRRAAVRADDFTYLEIYDGFAFHVWFWLDGLGLAPEGSAPHLISEGALPPFNISGGSIGMGRLHGGAQVVEAVRQIQGRAGDRQIADPSLVFVSAGAPITGAGVLILRADER
jgi:acetyl-CoA acetyltransferase